jgi:hypothetical protein
MGRELRTRFLSVRPFVPFGSASQGLARKQLESRAIAHRHRGRGGMMIMRLVVLEVFENVANVEKRIAIQGDVHESGLHTGEDASDFSFVDAADESEFFFPLDVNFD